MAASRTALFLLLKWTTNKAILLGGVAARRTPSKASSARLPNNCARVANEPRRARRTTSAPHPVGTSANIDHILQIGFGHLIKIAAEDDGKRAHVGARSGAQFTAVALNLRAAASEMNRRVAEHVRTDRSTVGCSDRVVLKMARRSLSSPT